jgi:hypothetical protein
MFTLCDKAPGTINTRGMELDEFQILKGKSGTNDHGISISRASVGARAAEVRSPVTTRRQDGLVRAETMECAVFHVQSNDTHALAILHDQVEGKVLDEEVGVVTQRLAVERVQEGMAGTVSGGCATVGLASLSVFKDCPPKAR